MTPQTRSRLLLLVLAALFAAPLVGAILLHASGWRPAQTRNHGELLQPPVALGDLVLRRADGRVYDWEPAARRWRVAVIAPERCTDACRELIAGLDKVWQLQGRRADRLDVLWFGPVPPDVVAFRRFVPMQRSDELVSRLPRAAAAELATPPGAWLIDPAGFLALRYAPGFDVAHLRADVAQLLKH